MPSKKKVNDDIYKAEYIVKSRWNERKGEIEYLVKWDGWTHRNNTWEPRRNIIDPLLIQIYEEREKNKKKPIKKKKKKYVFFEGDDDDESSEDERTEVKLINSSAPYSQQHSRGSVESAATAATIPEDEEDQEEDREEDTTNEDSFSHSNEVDLKSNDNKSIDYALLNNDLNISTDYADSTDSHLIISDELEETKDDETTNDTLNDESCNNSLDDCNQLVKRKIDQEEDDDYNESSQFAIQLRKLMKFDSNDQNVNQLDNQFNNTNQSADKINAVKNVFDKNNNQREEINDKLIYSPNGKNEHCDYLSSNKQLKSIKPELLKKKSNLLDSVVITDVTSNNTTITVRESKSQKFFFKDGKKSANNVNSQ